jgi:hypothetical protein
MNLRFIRGAAKMKRARARAPRRTRTSEGTPPRDLGTAPERAREYMTQVVVVHLPRIVP